VTNKQEIYLTNLTSKINNKTINLSHPDIKTVILRRDKRSIRKIRRKTKEDIMSHNSTKMKNNSMKRMISKISYNNKHPKIPMKSLKWIPVQSSQIMDHKKVPIY